MQIDAEKRYQTLVILWLALMISVGMYFLFALFAAPAFHTGSLQSTSLPLLVTLTALGLFFVILSLVVKRRLLERSVTQQDLGLVQKSLVIGCAMCEVSALLGLLASFLIGGRDYYLLFVIAALGMALHFPRRLQLQAASYRNQEKSD
jgi:hypothetical protein